MAITTTFDPPLPSDSPAVFNTKAFTLLGDLNDWSTEANALQTDVNAKQATASAAATTATTQAGLATAAYDSFDDRYLGAKASNPTLDNDGAALLTGALYWNTAEAEMRVYTGSAWTALNATTGIAQAINVNSATTALRVTQTGAGNAFVVEDAASDSTPFVIDGNGNAVAGHTSALAATVSQTPKIQVISTVATGISGGVFGAFNCRADTSCGGLSFNKSRATTPGTNALVAGGDSLGIIRFAGDDGAALLQAATIQADVDGTPGLNDMPGRLVFSTTPDGASAPVEAMRITSGQGVQIARTAVTAPVAADGNVYSGTYTPTLTNVTNIAVSTAAVCQYMRVGNVVTVSGSVTIDPTAAGRITMRVSLPIASNFASATQAGGTFVATGVTTVNVGAISADLTNDTLVFDGVVADIASQVYFFSATYQVI